MMTAHFKPMFYRTAALTSLCAVLAGSAVADPVTDYIASTVKAGDEAVVLSGDLNADGIPEAVVVTPDGSWTLLSSVAALDGEVIPVMTGSAHSAEDVFIEDMGDGVGVVVSGSVYWSLDGGVAAPYYSLLEREEANWIPASFADHASAEALTGLPYSDDMNLQVYLEDINGNGKRERVIVVAGSAYGMSGNLSPYVIVGSDNTVLTEGLTMDIPRIYPDVTGGGATIYDVAPSGMTEKHIGA